MGVVSRLIRATVLGCCLFALTACSGKDGSAPVAAGTMPVQGETSVVVAGAYYAGLFDFAGSVALAIAPDGTWREIADTADPMSWALDSPAIECLDSSSAECFRPLKDRVGVERRLGSGAWTIDWALTEQQRGYAAASYGLPASGLQLRTLDMAVFETRSGPVVVAVNGRDGFAVRGANGVWQRIGWEGVPGLTVAPVPALPGEVGFVARTSVAPWLPLAGMLATVAITFAARRRVRSGSSPTTRRLTSSGLGLVGTALIATLWIRDARLSYLRPPTLGSTGLVLLGMAVGALLAIVGVAFATAKPEEDSSTA